MTDTETEQREFLGKVLAPTNLTLTQRLRQGVGNKRPFAQFRSIVADYMESHGGSLDDVVLDVFHSLMRMSKLGDVNAMRLLLDRLCGKEAEQIDVNISATLTDTERAARINSILATARARQAITVNTAPPTPSAS